MIIAVGSRGDVDPYTGVGARLSAEGYGVTIAADRAFENLVTTAGLQFRPLWTHLRDESGTANETSQGYARDGLFSRSGLDMLAAAPRRTARDHPGRLGRPRGPRRRPAHHR